MKLGFKAVEDRCHVSDLHATLLHLMGLDHTKLSYFHGGLDQRPDRSGRTPGNSAGVGVVPAFRVAHSG